MCPFCIEKPALLISWGSLAFITSVWLTHFVPLCVLHTEAVRVLHCFSWVITIKENKTNTQKHSSYTQKHRYNGTGTTKYNYF